ncbi:hypothetical protein [Anaerotruncus rubiinfantis]|uniref:hypothetical protein n=1 Tax=Anaerotruncus rubiinfantis TaxID=1720200 RepID=UPI00189A4FFF|nr:hypothetical protein [Anaerotruncus rubiinfantis]
MFGGAFGHTRFGLRSGASQDIQIRLYLSEVFGGLATIGKDMPVITGAVYFSERLNGSAIASIGIPFGMDLHTELLSRIAANADIIIRASLAAQVDGQFYSAKDICPSFSLNESLNGSFYTAKDMRVAFLFEEGLLGVTGVVKDFLHASRLAETVGCTVVTSILDRETTVITVTIPAGSTLTIDSENFEVYLDGQSILHLQGGDWIRLNRELVDFIVDTGTGGQLDGTVLYRERYL